MSRSLVAKLTVLLAFSWLAVACGDDDKTTKTCDVQYVANCVENTAQVCKDGEIVETNCGDKICKDGVCVADQTKTCDATYKASCTGNVAYTCVGNLVVETNCGDKVCKDGVCEKAEVLECDDSHTKVCVGHALETCVNGKLVETDCGDNEGCWHGACADLPAAPKEGDACTVDACADNAFYKCNSKLYAAPIACGSDVCSIDTKGHGSCLKPCTKADYDKLLKVCKKDSSGAYIQTLYCDPDALGNYVYNYDSNEEEEDCPASCSEGKCVKLTADDGKPCDLENFVERCDKGYVVFCEMRYNWDKDDFVDLVTVMDCSQTPVPTSTCQVRKSDNYAACALPCTEGDPTIGRCDRGNDSYTLVKKDCAEVKDTSSFYYFTADVVSNCESCDASTLTCK